MSAPVRRVGSGLVVRSFPPVPLAAVAEAVRAEVRGDPTALLEEVALDPEEVVEGTLFCCVRGARVDGHDLARIAVQRGARALLVERWLAIEVPQLLVPSVRAAIGPAAATVYGRPAEDLTVVAVTGTNGKTTVTYLLESIFAGAGLRPGLIGTTGARVDGEPVATALTTPEAPGLHRLLARMRDAGVRAVAMEVTSHALVQGRVDGIVADVAVFTNLSQDHLDFHRTMEAYFEAKASLFAPERARRGVVNLGDPWGARLAGIARVPVSTFALAAPADLTASDVEVRTDGSRFRVEGVEVRTALRGRFNVENCLAALAAARVLGLDLAQAAAAIAGAPGVPGRMEPVDAGQDFLVLVDYAHTPAGLATAIAEARALATGRVIVVFGCGGDRDRTKRRAMGLAATSGADLSILTSDNPRSEDPLAIIAQVEEGARAGSGAFEVEPDRRAAIAAALRAARRGDVVLIAGKGHEAVQAFADRTVPFDDRAVAHEELRAVLEGA
jgi:UDP-N-acetylmuramoyl-L-alanyl-D-glutamate--2,6-diaminopimelate ligase